MSPVETAFERLLASKLQDPAIRQAFEDEKQLKELIDDLVAARRELQLSQAEVARRMGVKQPTVSGFETEASDPKLSTLLRYARAVEAHLSMKVLPRSPERCLPLRGAYAGGEHQAMLDAVKVVPTTSLRAEALRTISQNAAHNSKRSDFALAG